LAAALEGAEEVFGFADARVAARAAAAVFCAADGAAAGAALAAGFFAAVAALLPPFGIAAATSEISTFLAPRFGAAPAASRPVAFAAGFLVVVLANLSSLMLRRRAPSLGKADRLRRGPLRAGLSGYVGRARRKAQAASPEAARTYWP
jgi:hypothetical protein